MAAMLFWSVLAYLFISRTILQSTEIVGVSMAPRFQAGERELIHRWRYLFADPRRGDIVAVQLPGEDELMVKRIVGMPGERLAIRRGLVYVDREPLPEPYLPRNTVTWPGYLHGSAWRIAADAYFVLGDNRRFSIDSRHFGAVPRSSIVGRIAPGPSP